ncbi:MAG TPA: protein kinase [Vicinamibacteria bacterium]|nr:protein kinase [Vicinamibacteria bacterium]
MDCPRCQAPNPETAFRCSGCGHDLGIRRGVVLGGRYEVLEALGSGGMGVVFKAHDRELDEIVAVKVLRAEVATDPTMTARFLSEIKLARRVRHPNVCAIHEYGQDGPCRFIVMEYVEGADLRATLRARGALSPAEVVEVGLQLAAGLDAIHVQGIVHRDLKTPNVMWSPNGMLRLMDFGIAKRVEGTLDAGATAVGLMVGTPEYMSPEQVRGETVDRRSDLYSLGIVLFELLTGARPFQAATPLGIILKQINEPPPLDGPQAAKIPPPLVEVLRRLLAKDRAERFASAGELITTLQGVRAELESTAGQAGGTAMARPSRMAGATAVAPLTVQQQPSRTIRRPVLLLGGGLAALLVVLGGAAWVAWWVVDRGWLALWPKAAPASSSATLSRPPATVPTTMAVRPVATPTPASSEEGNRRDLARRLVASGSHALRRAEAGGGQAARDEALAAFRRALELDPANDEARELAAAAARPGRSSGQTARAEPVRPTPTPTVVAPTPGVPLVGFEQGDTRFLDPVDSTPPGFRGGSSATAVRATQPHLPKAQLVIEVDPGKLRPGAAYAVRYSLFNSSSGPLSIARVSVRNHAGAQVTGGPVEPLARTAPPATRTLLLETSGTWNWDPGTEWATTLEVVLGDGSAYSGTLRSRPVGR